MKGPRPDTEAASGGKKARLLARVTGLLPALFMKYERLCERIASKGVHNVAFFLSTAFLAPVGLYVWESRKGRSLPGRLWRGVAAWILLILAVGAILNGGWALGVIAFVLGRPFGWFLRVTRLARARPGGRFSQAPLIFRAWRARLVS